MKITLFLILLSITGVFAKSGYSQEALVNLNLNNAKVYQILAEIEKQSEFRFFFNRDQIDTERRVSITANKVKISKVLNDLFNNTDIAYEVIESHIVLVSKEKINARQLISISGIVYDSKDNLPIPGVNIQVLGTNQGTITDMDGKFTIDVNTANATLIFSFMGYQTLELPLEDNTKLDIQLVQEDKALDEVLVVGYGTQKKRDIIGSVSTIDMKDFGSKSNGSFDTGLQGMAGGVSVQSQSGAPGSASVIKIRGANTILAGTNPLWIVDGMPIYSSPTGLGSSGVNPMTLINSNDIESIQILKDAAATSIYGSRASNGVIIVTTKSGKKGEGTLAVNYSTGISNLSRTPDDIGYVNTEDWFKVMDKAYQNTYGSDFTMNDHYRFVPLATTMLTRDEAMNIHTNWYDETFRTGSFSDFNISSTQGFEKGSLFLSANYRKDVGVQNNNDFDRFSVRSNLTFNPTKNLTLGAKLTFSINNNDKRSYGVTNLVTYTLPWFPVYVPGSETNYYNPYTGSNPVASSDPNNYLNNIKQYRGLGSLFLNYQLPVKGLSFRTELAGDFLQSNAVEWYSREIWLNGAQKPTARASEEAVTYNSINYNGFLTYDRTFDVHKLTIVAGGEATRTSQYTRNLRGEGLTGKYQEIGTPNVFTYMYGGKNNERYLMGFFGRANYSYNDKYLIGASIREDGTSAFTEDYRWGTFYSASVGWVISQEEFMSFLGENNFLKIRGSYGETGNQNVQSGLDVVNYNGSLIYGSQSILGVNGTVPVNLAVANLTWESTKSSDLGIDFGFLNSRINGSLAYYHRLVYQMLLPAPVPVSAGVSSPVGNVYDERANNIMANIGDLVNSGLELELHSVNILKGDFKWSTDFNISFNRNVIKSLTPEADESGKGIVSTTTVSRTGEIREEWFVADYAGVDRLTGVPMIYALDRQKYDATGETSRLKDKNGNDSLTYATRTNISANRFYQTGKSADPKYYGGLTNTFTYKGFDFSFLISFSGGNYILDYDRQLAAVPSETRIVLKELYDNAWEKPGDVSKYPQLTARGTYKIDGVNSSDFGDSYVYHNRELYKGDFIRLRNIQLGYNFPSAWTQKIKVQNLRIYATATNLFTFTKYPGFDPEGAGLIYYSSAIPQLKSIIFGLSLKF